MKTVTFQTVLTLAATMSMRTFDQIPVQEYDSLQRFLADWFRIGWNRWPWPALIPPIANVQAANHQFSKNEGQASEIGDIIGIYHFNPQACVHRRMVPYIGWYPGDNVIYVETNCTNLWVEYKLPYPSVAWPDLSPANMNTAVFLAAVCPDFLQTFLALKASARLLDSDTPGEGAVKLKEAELALVDEVNRLPPAPWWRNQLRLGHSSHRRHGRY